MILSHEQLVAIVRFAENEEVVVSNSFTLDVENEPSTINVGRRSDESIVRVADDGTTFVIQSGRRRHHTVNEFGESDVPICWCGEIHPLAGVPWGVRSDG